MDILVKKIKKCIKKRINKDIKKQLMKMSLSMRKRKILSMRYIKGSGLEIGALHNPLPLPKGATSTNVDLFSREENIKQYPELDASEIVITDVIDDGFVLSTIPESSQDFIIANHVLEHSQNPLQALINWADKIRPNGILFLTVPIAAKCFDRGRALTTLQHLVDDFNLCKRGELNQFHERNKQHFIEYIHISEPNIHSERYDDYVMPSASELEKRIGETRMENCNIHFHTFSADSFWNLVSFLSTQVYKALSVETVEKNRAEIIAILRKS